MSLLERYERNLEKCVEFLKTSKSLITEYLDENERETELNKLKKTTEFYCDVNHDFQNSLRALEKVQEQINSTEETNTVDVQQLYEQNLNSNCEKEPYTKTDIWNNVFEGISDVVEIKQKTKQLHDSQFEELDDSMFCSNVFTPPVDPISKAIIREPVRNKKCKHVYERAMIMDYIQRQKRKAKCPYIGCNARQLLMTDIVEDSQLQSQITQYIESHADEDTEEDDD